MSRKNKVDTPRYLTPWQRAKRKRFESRKPKQDAFEKANGITFTENPKTYLWSDMYANA